MRLLLQSETSGLSSRVSAFTRRLVPSQGRLERNAKALKCPVPSPSAKTSAKAKVFVQGLEDSALRGRVLSSLCPQEKGKRPSGSSTQAFFEGPEAFLNVSVGDLRVPQAL